MNLIQSYTIEKKGFFPVLVRDSWQVGVLNYTDAFHITALNSLQIHQKTARCFGLLKGQAVLIAMDTSNQKSSFKIVPMQRGVSYNIPKNTRYAIAMEEGTKVFTVEKQQTHLTDVAYYPLHEKELTTIRLQLNKQTKNNNE